MDDGTAAAAVASGGSSQVARVSPGLLSELRGGVVQRGRHYRELASYSSAPMRQWAQPLRLGKRWVAAKEAALGITNCDLQRPRVYNMGRMSVRALNNNTPAQATPALRLAPS